MLLSSSHRSRGSWVLSLVTCAACWGCASEEIPKYGDPAQVAGGVGGSGGGTSAGGSGGAACVPDAACAVSFEADIFPVLDGTGKCASGSPCHGDGAGDITIQPDAASYLAVLKDISISTGKYVVPCEPENSQILCNLKVSDAADNPHGECGKTMPITAQDGPTVDQLKAIEDWIACGAPEN